MAHSTIQELKQKLACPTFDTIEIGALYYHYKNPQALYKILAIGLQEATEEPCVIYQSLDTELIWVRNTNSWLEKVYYNSTWVPRFCKKQASILLGISCRVCKRKFLRCRLI